MNNSDMPCQQNMKPDCDSQNLQFGLIHKLTYQETDCLDHSLSNS